jgi:ABC-2 type transport system permease protein
MATMARSMPQFGLLTTLIVFPMQNPICWCHATGEHARFVQDEMLRPPTTHFVSASQAILLRTGIDMIWHQMRTRSAIAAAFFTIALLRFRKPSFKRRDGFL